LKKSGQSKIQENQLSAPRGIIHQKDQGNGQSTVKKVEKETEDTQIA
jgi:hypothetical protein